MIEEKKVVSREKNGEPNGYLISLWKDWEKIFKVDPKQVYLNICHFQAIKGPHLHKNRWDYFVCVRGKVRFIIKWGRDYEEIEADADNNTVFKIVEVPPAIPCAIQNIGKGEAWFLNMPNPAWHPDNQDDHPVQFDGYEWHE